MFSTLSARFLRSHNSQDKFQGQRGLSIEVYEEGWLLCVLAYQRVPGTACAYEEKDLAFQRHFLKLCDSQQYLLGQISNANQTPVYFDMTSNMTVSVKGTCEVKLLTTGNEKLLFTVILSCLADGAKLCPYIVFKQKKMPLEAFPKSVVVRVKEKGNITNDMVVEWYRWCGSRGWGRPSKIMFPTSLC
ncbi:hypothetical protein HPB49_004490 [Dermacentor silvarum]|uniref:Uncharacterized protein n=1 Tax=Dermacentor silvarum TaxID=543639 RepID=A0ACB8DUW6_DERSI|nr:hypothetical protein HPB49_004490 [Dermacentor silvarum]